MAVITIMIAYAVQLMKEQMQARGRVASRKRFKEHQDEQCAVPPRLVRKGGEGRWRGTPQAWPGREGGAGEGPRGRGSRTSRIPGAARRPWYARSSPSTACSVLHLLVNATKTQADLTSTRSGVRKTSAPVGQRRHQFGDGGIFDAGSSTTPSQP